MRVYAALIATTREWVFSFQESKSNTHAADIQLPTPDPEAEKRQRFEEWFTKTYTGEQLRWTAEQTDMFAAYQAGCLAK